MPPQLGHDGPTPSAYAAHGEHLARSRAGSGFSAASRLPSFEDRPEVCGWEPLAGVRVVSPMHYESGFAYPLLVWLPNDGDTEHEAAQWIERVSDRNSLGLGLRPSLYRGEFVSPSAGLDRYRQVMRCVEASMRVHPTRRYIAGHGASARTAIEWLLRRPEWFAGAIVLDAPAEGTFAARVSAAPLLDRRVLWLDARPEPAESNALREALGAVGIGVESRKFHGLDAESEALREIDRWMLTQSGVPVVA